MKMMREKTKQSIEERTGKRRYERTSANQSWARLKIRDEDGWNDDMRQRYFRLMSNLDKAIQANDYTDLNIRPKGISKRDVKNGLKADGIWSDSQYDRVRDTGSQFLRYVVENTPKVKNLKDINHHDVTNYLKSKKDDGCTAKTINNYYGYIQKMAECTFKYGVKSHEKLVRESHKEMVPPVKKEERVRGRGETDGKKGYTLEQARTIISHLADDPFAQSAATMLTYAGPRIDCMMEMKWSEVLDDNGEIAEYMDWTREGLTKSGRQQIAETNEDIRSSLKELWDTGLFKEDEQIWGSRFTQYTLKTAIEDACTASGVDRKGFHEFRSATVQYYEREKLAEMNKEQIVEGILKMVNIEVKDKKGNTYKPHNPVVKKEERKRDENGYTMYGKNSSGKPYPLFVTKTDKHGHPVYGEKWTKEELMTKRIDYLKNIYIAEQLSHNRPDANQPYRNG